MLPYERECNNRSGGRPALRSTIPFCTSMAQRTASTTLLNSMRTAVARPLDDAAMMQSNGGVEQIAAERTKPRKRTFLVAAGEAAEADHVSGEDCC
jgi:hypothetical protein